TIADVAATDNKEDHFSWVYNNAFAQKSSVAHTGFTLHVPEDVESYWIIFGVDVSTEQDKWRGPFNNTQDICWHFHGNVDDWKIWPC
ncbi:103_t:CDS:1, partial [Gigaspora rosea]